MKGTALITGASSGIGYELAKEFARHGHDLVLVARRREILESLARELRQRNGVSVCVIAKDLAKSRAPEEIHGELEKKKISVDILVNNAGVAAYGLFSETDLKKDMQMMQLNMVALTHLTKIFVKDMARKKRGKILNVSSLAALQPGPLMAVYYASKAYVLSFSEALENELKDTGITVTTLLPGPTKTEGFQFEKSFLDYFSADPEKVAKAAYNGLMQNKTIVIPGFRHKVLALGSKIVPRKIATRLARKFHERK
jgi:short-subunit dehydrogenase